MMTKPASRGIGFLLIFARDILRKDEGLNGDLDRLPLLAWIMFLKLVRAESPQWDSLGRSESASAAQVTVINRNLPSSVRATQAYVSILG